jgi:murein DD-endopeptidase MepM/ murein hydrolase activator NlpD
MLRHLDCLPKAMYRVLRLLFTSGLSAMLALAAYPLQSDTHPINCEVEVECIGRLPYSQPLTLINPVLGGTRASIGSMWGDVRDNGKRKHEGMDIFAPLGTPVVAPVEGIITKVGWNPLGGKVIRLTSQRTQHTYYFAHLAGFNVCQGDVVAQGDILGTIGNTGNARFTSPHLHFGIYSPDAKRAMNRDIVWIETHKTATLAHLQ